ncbi:hypothetical protein TcWFU_002015 [Taenia crassiceps]|uniref:Uncharacterized protein n=1 Tax=Taenia crassiceps TaxID=6207 RepID=A0ABR4QFX3_9CEST
MTASVNVGENRLRRSGYGRVIHCCDGCYDEDVDLPDAISGGNEDAVNSDVNDPTLSLRLLRGVRSLPRKALQVADWAGERLAGMVGITDSKFDIYLWQREYEAQKKAEEEANNFIIDPVPSGKDIALHMEAKRSNADGQGEV